jgi:large subunit ribosomal protein L25
VSEVKLSAAKRTEFGKGAARRLRRAQQVPAVIYGHGTDPVHVSLPGHATMLALKQSNTLLTLDVEGSPTLALPKAIQRDPLRGTIEHVDLLIVRRGEKVTVDVALHITGNPAPGTLVTNELNTLSVEVDAAAIPSQISFDISGAQPGTTISAGEIPLPEGAILVTDADATALHFASATQDLADESAESAAE